MASGRGRTTKEVTMRPNDESTIRAGARAHDAGADTSNGTKQIEIQVEIPLREGDKISGPYPHGNQWRLQIRGADGKVRRIASPTRDAAVRVQDRAEHDVGIDNEPHFTSRLRFFAYHVRLTSAAKLSTTFCGTL